MGIGAGGWNMSGCVLTGDGSAGCEVSACRGTGGVGCGVRARVMHVWV